MTTKRKKFLVLIFGFFSILIFSYFFIFLNYKKTKEIYKEIFVNKVKLENIEKREKNIQEFKEKLGKENITFFEAFFVDKNFPISFINFLEKMAKDSQLKIEISFLETKNKKENFLRFQLKILGENQNLFRFLEKIENSPFLIQIEKISISKLKEEKEEKEISPPLLNLSLNLKVKVK